MKLLIKTSSERYWVSAACWARRASLLVFAIALAAAAIAYWRLDNGDAGDGSLIPAWLLMMGAIAVAYAFIKTSLAKPLAVETSSLDLRWLDANGWHVLQWQQLVEFVRTDLRSGKGRKRFIRLRSGNGRCVTITSDFTGYRRLADTAEKFAKERLDRSKRVKYPGPFATGTVTVWTRPGRYYSSALGLDPISSSCPRK